MDPLVRIAPTTDQEDRGESATRDFIDLVAGDAFLILELVGRQSQGADGLTTPERLSEAVRVELEDPHVSILLYWDDHSVEHTDLPDRLRSLSARQAQCIVSAARRAWKLLEVHDCDETQALMAVGLIRNRP